MNLSAKSFRPALLTAGLLIFCVAIVATSVNTRAAEKQAARPGIAGVDVGIRGYFKVGYWTPIRVEIRDAGELKEPRVEVEVADNNGVPTTAYQQVSSSDSKDSSQKTFTVYTKVGRIGNPIRVSLLDGGRMIDTRTVRPAIKEQPKSPAVALPATSELILSIGTAPFGLQPAIPDRAAEGAFAGRKLLDIGRIAELPSEWLGFDAVDLVVISCGDGKIGGELAADANRFSALVRWVELGGKLVVLCGPQSAKELMATGAPLASLAPGKFEEIVPVTKTGAVERFAGAAAIPLEPGKMLSVPRFSDVTGKVEVQADRATGKLPIVVRLPKGLGEIEFAGVDLSTSPLTDWSGRSAFLQVLLRPYLVSTNAYESSQRLVTRGYNDLGGALRQQLGQSFPGVAPVGFAIVAILAITYMVFLGPFDWLLVNRWVRRPWLAWISFPVIVLAFCGAAMSLGVWRGKAAGVHANQLEVIDVDTISGRSRGTLWTSLYSGRARRFDLRMEKVASSEAKATSMDGQLSWWGLPGVGIGGMQAGGIDLGIIHDGYDYGEKRQTLLGVPVLASSTKSLVGQWTATGLPQPKAELIDEDGLATGSIVNDTGLRLTNVRLFYGTWAYRLGDIVAGQRVEVGEQLSPRKAKTIVVHDALGQKIAGPTENVTFIPEQATAQELIRLIMFYDVAGGFGFAHLPNRYLAYCDLSRSLDLGRAILVADADRPYARLVDDTAGDVRDDLAETTVIYRFILPVKPRTGPAH